ncbi:MAG: leucyl aminopeptidase [Candidatus Magasanikbacteria bacterium CG10_big_fil_rev_8_21_14_0_10_38_6]|uniref:Leucyl aminopeptidase n=1 Tax=Candidatus Magasanikbacteria bacterium CG10_big_fil_rev_8_21_14_0_10_38_6 TaxID=1974647 RepID=A0A2M6P0W7_9BACT|nr:MAG: leucyl aminopeptidase [Candidatus Magasanikbacteria bacterium CG10_big_fil_rev_8_21_14_0_10_38_6]
MALQGKKAAACSLLIPQVVVHSFGVKKVATEIGIAMEMAQYSFDTFKEEAAKVSALMHVHIICSLDAKQKKVWEQGMEEGQHIASGVLFTRELGNTPPSVMTPALLAKKAVELAKGNSAFTTTVFDEAQMKKLGMGCLLGVAQGSVLEPKFIVMEYKGTEKKVKPTVLVGKGITFDTGGLSIKPGNYMTDMKFDMLGAGTVLGIMKAVMQLGLKKHIVGIVPTCENAVSGEAYRPDDILTAMNGKTVEVQNTDAEGRLILADALSYVVKEYAHAKEVIDFATLTGACVVALGNERSGLFSPDDGLAQKLYDHAQAVGEHLWRLPVGEEYSDAIKSLVADVKNVGGVGGDRYAGASTAAAFLQYFTKDHESGETPFPWAHIDLSCSYYSGKGQAWIRHGANGFGVQAIVDYLRG